MAASDPHASLLRESMYFVALAETRNLRAAATRLNVTSAAIRAGVLRLAKRTHRTHLFVGTRGNSVTITPEGEQLLVIARRLVEDATRMTDDTIRLRFTTFPRLVARAAPAIDAFHASKRNTGIRVWYHDVSDEHRRDGGRGLVRRAAHGELDLVVASSGYADETNVASNDVYGWRLRVVLPHRHRPTQRDTIEVHDLEKLNIVCAPTGHASRELLDRAFGEARRPLSPVMEITDQNASRWMAHHSDNLAAILPSDAFDAAERPEALGPVLVGPAGWYAQRYSVYRSTALDDSADERHQRRQESLRRLAQRVAAELAGYDDDPGGRPTPTSM